MIFRFVFDAMHAVTGAYAGPIFVEKLGADAVTYPLLQMKI
jgi:phosphoglucomutase